MQKEIRKALERSLPQYVLDYLTEEFNKFEQCLEKLKYMEKKHEQMLYDLAEKDRVIYRALERSGVVKEGSEVGGSIGFNYDSGKRSYGPWDRRGRGESGRFTSGDWDETEGPYMAQGRNAGVPNNRYSPYASSHPQVYAPYYPDQNEQPTRPMRQPQDAAGAQGGQSSSSGQGSSSGSSQGAGQSGGQGSSGNGQSGQGPTSHYERGQEEPPRWLSLGRNPYPEELGGDAKPE